ncbi:MAG TPA: hypothetical protein PLV05_09705, partial [Verrucomicrobiota bacterium]|nr:hypothetical protein [Verrucomicrobiota bacterium]HRR64932.1 hypothetical protein [Candidatus Paceibacterota bacterium]HOQ55973.1 hypothetical protein [Verrucomicrobiota bacterium]HOW80589.1 hypothetical protein [Verrucomicrobiota bacterium]HPC53359.1 hypothetical protein [Verrucomicrobiota bacterium]
PLPNRKHIVLIIIEKWYYAGRSQLRRVQFQSRDSEPLSLEPDRFTLYENHRNLVFWDEMRAGS